MTDAISKIARVESFVTVESLDLNRSSGFYFPRFELYLGELDGAKDNSCSPRLFETPRSFHSLHQGWLSSPPPQDDINNGSEVVEMYFSSLPEYLRPDSLHLSSDDMLRRDIVELFMKAFNDIADIQSLDVLNSPPPPNPPDWIRISWELQAVLHQKDNVKEHVEPVLCSAKVLLKQVCVWTKKTLQRADQYDKFVRERCRIRSVRFERSFFIFSTLSAASEDVAESFLDASDHYEIQQQKAATRFAMLKMISEFADMLHVSNSSSKWTRFAEDLLYAKMIQETSAGSLLAETAQEQAIKTIQRWIRKWFQKKVKSSIKIQSFYRGCKDRNYVKHLQNMKSVDYALHDLETKMMIKSEEIFLLDTIRINETASKSTELKESAAASSKEIKRTKTTKSETRTTDNDDDMQQKQRAEEESRLNSLWSLIESSGDQMRMNALQRLSRSTSPIAIYGSANPLRLRALGIRSDTYEHAGKRSASALDFNRSSPIFEQDDITAPLADLSFDLSEERGEFSTSVALTSASHLSSHLSSRLSTTSFPSISHPLRNRSVDVPFLSRTLRTQTILPSAGAKLLSKRFHREKGEQ